MLTLIVKCFMCKGSGLGKCVDGNIHKECQACNGMGEIEIEVKSISKINIVTG